MRCALRVCHVEVKSDGGVSQKGPVKLKGSWLSCRRRAGKHGLRQRASTLYDCNTTAIRPNPGTPSTLDPSVLEHGTWLDSRMTGYSDSARTALRALARPVFLRSTIRGSRLSSFATIDITSVLRVHILVVLTRNRPLRSRGSTSGACAARALAIPRVTAPLWPVLPPPRTRANTLYAPRRPATRNGRTMRSRSETWGLWRQYEQMRHGQRRANQLTSTLREERC